MCRESYTWLTAHFHAHFSHTAHSPFTLTHRTVGSVHIYMHTSGACKRTVTKGSDVIFRAKLRGCHGRFVALRTYGIQLGSPSGWDLGERVRAPVAQPRDIVKLQALVRRMLVFSETSLSLGVSSSHVTSLE